MSTIVTTGLTSCDNWVSVDAPHSFNSPLLFLMDFSAVADEPIIQIPADEWVEMKKVC